MRRAVSLLDIKRAFTDLPSTTTTTWRLDPPAGVRKHPDTSSKRTSARCTLCPASFGRVRLYTPPTILRPWRFASTTLARLMGLIRASRRRVSSAVNQDALLGFSSITSAKLTLRLGGSGRFHHIHPRLVFGASFSYAALSVRVCQGANGPFAIRLSGTFTSF